MGTTIIEDVLVVVTSSNVCVNDKGLSIFSLIRMYKIKYNWRKKKNLWLNFTFSKPFHLVTHIFSLIKFEESPHNTVHLAPPLWVVLLGSNKLKDYIY